MENGEETRGKEGTWWEERKILKVVVFFTCSAL